jgi:hypothetical protein
MVMGASVKLAAKLEAGNSLSEPPNGPGNWAHLSMGIGGFAIEWKTKKNIGRQLETTSK